MCKPKGIHGLSSPDCTPLDTLICIFFIYTMSLQKLATKVVIIGSGPAGHTAAIYTARALLQPILLEGWMANGVAAGGQARSPS